MPHIHLFAGANSALGFFSLYHHLAANDLNRVYILKGGPGTGKSTLIKEVAKSFGEGLELYHCTAAPDSLDGLIIPSRQVSVIDGTPPHAIEPVLPGAVQQAIDLGRYWDWRGLRARRRELAELTTSIKAAYSLAYGWLKTAASASELAEVGQVASANAVADSFAAISALLPDKAAGQEREAFASAISGQGPISFLPGLPAKKKIALVGSNRAFKAEVLAKVACRLKRQAIPAFYLRCAFRPESLEHIYIPGEFALFSSHPPHEIKAADRYLGPEPQRSGLEGQLADCFGRAIEALAAAAKLHGEQEAIYRPQMDYRQSSQWGRRIVHEILSLKR